MANNIWEVLRDLGPFVQINKRENTRGGVLLLVTKSFSRFLNCANGTKIVQSTSFYKTNR